MIIKKENLIGLWKALSKKNGWINLFLIRTHNAMDRIDVAQNDYTGNIDRADLKPAATGTVLSHVIGVSNQPATPCDGVDPPPPSMTPNAINTALIDRGKLPVAPVNYSSHYYVDKDNIDDFVRKVRGSQQPFTYQHQFTRVNFSKDFDSLLPEYGKNFGPVIIRNQQFYDIVLPGKGSYGKWLIIDGCLFSAREESILWKDIILGRITKVFSKNIIRGGGNDDDLSSWGKAYRVDISDVDMTHSDISNMRFYYEPNTVIKNGNLSNSIFKNVIFASLYAPVEHFYLDASFENISAENFYLEGVKYSGSLVGAKIKNFSLFGHVDFKDADFGDSYHNGDISLNPAMVTSANYIDYNLINKADRPGNLYPILDSLSSQDVRVDWAEQLVAMFDSVKLLKNTLAESNMLRQSIIKELGKSCYQNSAMINDFVKRVQKESA